MYAVMEAFCLGKPFVAFGFHPFFLRKDVIFPIYHTLAAHQQTTAEIQCLIMVQIILCHSFRIFIADRMSELGQFIFRGIIKNCTVKIHQQAHLLKEIPAHFSKIADLVNLVCNIIENNPIIGLLNMQIISPPPKNQKKIVKKGVLRNCSVKRPCLTWCILP